MEKFLKSAKAKCLKFKLKCQTNLGKSIDHLPKSGFIDTSEGEMKIIKVKADGNCQFRSVGILLTGMDNDKNQNKLRALAVEEFEKIDETELKRTVFFTHDENDCLTPQTCKHANEHVGTILNSSTRPFRKTVVNRKDFVVEMSKNKTWGNEYTIESLAKALNVKVNVIQKDLTDGSFNKKCSFCPQGDMEVNILYSYEGGHYEALVPKVWNLSGESSPQADFLAERKFKPGRSFNSEPRKEKLVKTKRKGPPSVLDFNLWYKKQKLNEDKNDNFPVTDSKEQVDDMCNEVPVRKRKKRDRSDSDSSSDSETDANMVPSKYVKKADLERKKSKIFGTDSDSASGSGTDAHILSSKYERKVDVDTEDTVDKENKKEVFQKVSVDKVKEGMQQKQQTIPSMFFKSIKPSKKECDILVEDTSPQEGLSVQVKKSGSQESGLKKGTKRKCVVRGEWFQSHEAIVDVNGDKVNTYLRRVPLNKYQVSCYLCSHSISVEYKGFSAIQDHARGKKHQIRREEAQRDGNGNLGIYLEKSQTDEVTDAELALVSEIEEDMEDEEDMETYIVNGKPVFVKKGLHPKTILAIFCQQYELEFPVFRVTEINEYNPELKTFKAYFELEGKSVMGSARQKKEAESKAARKFLNNLFLSGESSPQAEKQVSSVKKKIPPKQTAKQNKRLEKFLQKKDQEREAREQAEARNQATKTDLRRIVSFDLERTCGPEDSEIIQLGYCTKDYRGNSFIFPRGKIDEKASMLSHKILVRNNQLVRNKEVLHTDTLHQAAEKFLQFLNKVKSEFGSPILVAHGTDHKTLLNNFATVGYDTKLCETIAGAVNFWNVINEDEKYPASSTLSLVKLTNGKKNLAQTVLGDEISREELSEAHDGLFDALLLLRVVERYAELYTPLESILDHHLMIASELISVVQYHMTRIRTRRKKDSRFLTFYGWFGA